MNLFFSPLIAVHSPSPGTLAELYWWLSAFIIFIIGGLLVIKKLRSEAKADFSSTDQSNPMASFEQLFRQNLITYDEYQMIQKNLRNQMVYDVVQTEKIAKKRKNDEENRRVKPEKPSKPGKMSESDKQKRLNSLLKDYKE